ncbi:hypothetical protein EDD16DRAFT_1528359 [Pisolithus croceorrhizus]|nr:hypothetical protein EDD16DRAFT_1528359 [Pisolithus croceorrhizus]
MEGNVKLDTQETWASINGQYHWDSTFGLSIKVHEVVQKALTSMVMLSKSGQVRSQGQLILSLFHSNEHMMVPQEGPHMLIVVTRHVKWLGGRVGLYGELVPSGRENLVLNDSNVVQFTIGREWDISKNPGFGTEAQTHRWYRFSTDQTRTPQEFCKYLTQKRRYYQEPASKGAEVAYDNIIQLLVNYNMCLCRKRRVQGNIPIIDGTLPP